MVIKQSTSEILFNETISLLARNIFKGAKDEVKKALSLYRRREYDLCIVKINNAFESTMKSILEEFNIPTANKKTGTLITALHQNKIMHPSLDNYAHALKNLFEKGLPNIRNREGVSHGQGKDIIKINQSYADFGISQANSLISHLVKRYNEVKKEDWLKKSNKFIEELKTLLSSTKGKTSTIKTYEPWTRKFLFELKKDPDAITERDIVDYLKKCKKKYSIQTLYVIFSTLKYFTNQVLKLKDFDYDDISKKANIGKFPSQRTTKKISQEEFDKILKKEPNPKHKLWIEFIWWTGATNKQFRNVKISHIKQNPIKITDGKREIYKAKLPYDLWERCKELVRSKEDASPYLFVGYKDAICSRTLQNALKLAGKRVGIKRSISCQALRISNKYKDITLEIVEKYKSQKKYSRLRGIRYPLKPLTEDELNKFCSGKVNQKHKLWFKIIYYLGMYQLKKNELYSLETKNINLKNKTIKIYSGINKLSEPSYNLFKIYFRKYPNNRYIFQNKNGKIISDHGMRDAIDRARRINNILKPINYENLHKSILELGGIT